MRTIVSVMTTPNRLQQLLRRRRDRATSRNAIEQPSPSTIMLESSSSARVADGGARRRAPPARARRACRSRSPAASARARCPVMTGERVQVRRADDVADLAQRGRRQLGVRLEAEQPADRRGVLGRQQHQHGRRHVALDAERDAGDLRLGRAELPRPRRPSGPRARPAPPGRPARPSISDSAVEAVPAPMFASSRSASSWMSLYVALTRPLLGQGRWLSGRRRRSRRSGRSARPRARRLPRGRSLRRSPAAAAA